MQALFKFYNIYTLSWRCFGLYNIVLRFNSVVLWPVQSEIDPASLFGDKLFLGREFGKEGSRLPHVNN